MRNVIPCRHLPEALDAAMKTLPRPEALSLENAVMDAVEMARTGLCCGSLLSAVRNMCEASFPELWQAFQAAITPPRPLQLAL